MDNVEKQTRTLTFNNELFTYFIMQNEGKETILMLHPAFADHTIFQKQVDYFKHSYQIILVDLPGHGSCYSHSSKITIKEIPDVINQILFDNSIDACHLLGVSMGSLVAQAFADRYPERVKSVCIVGGYSIHKANERIMKAQRREGLKWMLYFLFSMKKFRAYITTVSCHTDSGRALIAQATQHFRRKSFSAMSGMNTFFIKKDTPMPYPLLIVLGEHELKIILEGANELHALEKQSQLMVLPGAGHCANVDTPDAFNHALEHFLSSCPIK